jgi:hypothetical protein
VAEQIGAAFDNEETEADAVPMGNLVVLVEDAAEHPLRNADPRIRDLDREIAAPAAAADEDPSCPRVLDRVLDQIVEDAAKKFRVGNDLVPTGHHRQSQSLSLGVNCVLVTHLPEQRVDGERI